MRVSILLGLVIFLLGVGLSYLAYSMIQTQAMGPVQTAAVIISATLFIIFSATMLGLGTGLVIHWIIGFATHWKAFLAELILSFAMFFTGIGAAIMGGNIWLGLQIFFTFFIASVTLFSLSFISLFGGMAVGFVKVKKYAKKRFKKR